MSGAIKPRLEGDDCQAFVFWLHAVCLLDDSSFVELVEIESAAPKSIDDIVVHYREGKSDRLGPVSVDYHQVKYHVRRTKLITGKDLCNPAFINATKVSFLQKLKQAVDTIGGVSRRCRYYLDNCYPIDTKDALSELVSNVDGSIDVDALIKASQRSIIGKLRNEWMSHLEITNLAVLCEILKPLRIRHIDSLEEMREQLNLRLGHAGLKQVPEVSLTHQYLDLARGLIKNGTTILNRDSLILICQKEGLFASAQESYQNAVRIGIQSFSKNTFYLDDETFDTLDLRSCFIKHNLTQSMDWNKDIAQTVETFLEPRCKPGRSYLLALPAHGSIAVLAGSIVDTKSGINIAVLQPSCLDIVPWPIGAGQNISRTHSSWKSERIHLNPKGTDIVIAVSVSHSIVDDVKPYVEQNLPYAAELVHCRFNQCGENAVSGPEEGWGAIEALVDSIRHVRSQSRLTGTLHLFFSMPNAMAFFLGRHHLVLGRTQVYEFNCGTCSYQPSILFPAY